MFKYQSKKIVRLIIALVLFSITGNLLVTSAQEQTALQIVLIDQNSDFVWQAKLRLTKPSDKFVKEIQADKSGKTSFSPLKPDSYLLEVQAAGFKPVKKEITLTTGLNTVKIALEIEEINVDVEVKNDSPEIGTENAFSGTLNAKEMAALPENPKDLEAELKNRYGEDTVIRVDGFSGGIPSKSQIASIKVTRSSFDAEFHEIGNTVVDISTKAGGGKWGIFAYGAFNHSALNARKPFSLKKLPEQNSNIIFSAFGPLVKDKASFLFSVVSLNGYQTNNFASPNLTKNLKEVPKTQTRLFLPFVTLNYNVNKNNSFSIRYLPSFQRMTNLGIGAFELPEKGFSQQNNTHRIQFSDTAIISEKYVNQLRFEFTDSLAKTTANTQKQSIIVLGEFGSGGAKVNNSTHQTTFLLADNFFFDRTKDSFKLGTEIKFEKIKFINADNLNGEFVFSRLSDYHNNRPLNYSQRIEASEVKVAQIQTATFFQYDFRPSRNFQLGLGLRYELQNSLKDHNNISPRLSFTWSPEKTGKIIFRNGTGIFYQWLDAANLVNILSNDGKHGKELFVVNPPYPLSISEISLSQSLPLVSNIKTKDSRLTNPYILVFQSAVKFRPTNQTSIESLYTFRRGIHQFRSRDINAPVRNQRPNSNFGRIAEVESNGLLTQNSLETTFEGDLFKTITFSAKYKLSKSISDFSDIFALPMDNNNLGLEKGFSDNDQRHGFNVRTNFTILKNIKTQISFQAKSPLPSTILTGIDNNNDSVLNDRPLGIGRNTLRGSWSKQTDLRMSYDLPLGKNKNSNDRKKSASIELNISNLFNQTNFNRFIGIQTSPYFGKPISAAPPRRLEIGFSIFLF